VSSFCGQNVTFEEGGKFRNRKKYFLDIKGFYDNTQHVNASQKMEKRYNILLFVRDSFCFQNPELERVVRPPFVLLVRLDSSPQTEIICAIVSLQAAQNLLNALR